jgi:hypothetical protein
VQKYIDVCPDILFTNTTEKSKCMNAAVWQSGNNKETILNSLKK